MFFPRPYPDELLASVVMRFLRYYGAEQMQDPLREFFGLNSCALRVDGGSILPLVHQMLRGEYSLDDLLLKHTLWPVERWLLPGTNRYALLTKAKVRIKNDPLLSCSGFGYSQGNHHRQYARMRFCPHCIDEQKEKYGETYWVRDWCLPGIEVCHKHRIPLICTKTGLSASIYEFSLPDRTDAIRTCQTWSGSQGLAQDAHEILVKAPSSPYIMPRRMSFLSFKKFEGYYKVSEYLRIIFGSNGISAERMWLRTSCIWLCRWIYLRARYPDEDICKAIEEETYDILKL